MRIYENDILYSQGDNADDVFFILKGTIILHVDLNDPLINPEVMKLHNVAG